MLLPIILSGGVGARLWPVSREALPADHLILNQDSFAKAVASAVKLEVQSGKYLGEDDIVHFQDIYGRI